MNRRPRLGMIGNSVESLGIVQNNYGIDILKSEDYSNLSTYDLLIVNSAWLTPNLAIESVPFLVLGRSNDSESVKIQALKLGALDYLSFPVNSEELLIKVERILASNQSQKSWQKLIEKIPILIAKFDSQSRFSYINSSFEKSFNLSREEVLGKTNSEVTIHPDFQPIFNQINQLFDPKLPPLQQSYYQWELIPTPEETILIGQNITQLKETEQKAEESERRFRDLANQSPILIWLSDAQGKCTFVNRTWLNFTGRNLTEELGYGWLATVHPEEQDQYLHSYNNYIQQGKSAQLETRFLRCDGQYRWILEYFHPRYSTSGRLMGYVGCGIDISDRKEMEVELLQAKNSLEKRVKAALVLQKINQSIRSTLNFTEIYQSAVQHLGQELQASRVLIHTYHHQGESQLPVVAEYKQPDLISSLGMDALAQDNFYIHIILNQDQAYSCDNIYLESDLTHPTNLCLQLECKSILGIRTSYQGQVNGVICVHQCDDFRSWQPEEIQLLESVAEQLGIAIAQAQLLDQEKQENHQLLQQIKERQKIEARYRELLENQDQIMVCHWLRDGTLTYGNQSFCRFFGKSQSELPGHNLTDLISQDELELVAEYMDTLFKEMRPVTFEHPMTGVAKIRRWFSCTDKPIFNSQGEFIEFQSITIDITELKKKESIFSSIVAGTALSTGQDFFTTCVSQLAKLLPVRYALVAELITEGQKQSVNSLAFWYQGKILENGPLNLELLPCCQAILAKPDQKTHAGQEFWAKPFVNSQGEVIGYLSVATTQPLALTNEQEKIIAIFAARAGVELERDRITQASQKKSQIDYLLSQIAQTFLDENLESATRKIVSWIGDYMGCDGGYFYSYSDPESVTIAQSWCTTDGDNHPFLGSTWLVEQMQSQDLVVIHDLSDLSSPQPLPVASVLISQIKYGDSHLGCLSFHMVNKIKYWSEDESMLVQRAANLLAIAIVKQQTEQALQKAKEVAENAWRAKSDFLTRMSHELRTPLHAILGFSELVQQELPQSSQVQENLKVIYRSGQHLLSLMNNILSMATLEVKEVTVDCTTFELSSLIQFLQDMVSISAQAKGLELIFECSPDLPAHIHGDSTKLRQVLLNLLDNAVKYTDHGYVILHIIHEAGCFHFTVEDSGVGIASEELELLFKPFSQTSSGLRTHKGTGLGLAISQQYVDLMGGKIQVHSEKGKGSFFTVILPQPLGLNCSRDSYFNPHQILIIEDNSEDSQAIQSCLKKLKLPFQVSHNSKEVMQLCQHNKPDLIFTTLPIPSLQSYYTTQAIKTHLGDQSPPIIGILFQNIHQLPSGWDLSIFDQVIYPPIEEKILSKVSEYCHITLTKSIPILKPKPEILPPQWQENIQDAALHMDEEKISSLLAQIPPEYHQLHSHLNRLLQDFRFDLITKYFFNE